MLARPSRQDSGLLDIDREGNVPVVCISGSIEARLIR
jgi:hypothetical protein